MKVRIVDKVLAGYTGMLYQFEFVDGVSITDLTDAQAAMIGAVMRVENVESGQQVGAGVDAINARSVTLSDAQAKEKVTADQTAIDNPPIAPPTGQIDADHIDVSSIEVQTAPVEQDDQGETDASEMPWTADSLAAIADAKGIAGLRAIAEPKGIKGRSINELIREILAAQAEK